MKLTGIHVDGYGTLADLDLDGIAPSLTVVYGLNEAGKSTLLDFVRAVLFGFPDRRSRQNARPPLRGGRHGGSLRLLDEDGRPWVIERHADARDPVITGPDGRLGGDAELHALLGGANAGLFRSIFAFGLDELTSLENLDDDDVRDLVFTAGVLGAGRSATRAMRELENRRGTIVRQRSSDARANQLRHQLDDTEARLRTTRAAAEGYASAEAGHRRLQGETGTARERLDELRRRDVELDRLRSCWPYWNRIHDAEARLAALGPPSAAAEQLTRLASEIRRLDAECSAHELRLGALRQSQVELAGIERSRADLVEQRTHLEQSRPPVPAPGGRDRSDDPGVAPRDEAELRRADQEVLLLRGLIGQRDQLLAAQSQRETMERLARRSPGVSRPAIALVFVTPVLIATVVVAAFEFSKHNAALGAVGAVAALALGAAAALIITGARVGTISVPDRADSRLAPVDPKRLSAEIARAAEVLSLDRSPALVEVDAVATRLDEERDERRRRDELEHRLAELETKIAERDAAHRRLSRAIEAETATVEGFDASARRVAAACGLEGGESAAELCRQLASALAAAEQARDERRGLKETINRANSDLAEAAGFGPEADRLRDELATGDPASWESQSAAIKADVAAAEAVFQDARDAERDAEQSLEALRSSDEIATLEIERAALATQLEDALREWIVLGLGQALLEATFARYEREKQPAVIARAAELFRDVTAGRYVQLVAHEDERAAHHGIDAITARGERVDSGSLSRGTAEQLYLCLRLGLAATHAERTVSLPFVLDDVLVNFDPGRVTAVGGAIGNLARSHQVLAFTCHPHIVDVFRQADPDCTVIELALTDTIGAPPVA
ncbi:MAG: AAA family ATPase [Acidimicrobiales bacterium]